MGVAAEDGVRAVAGLLNVGPVAVRLAVSAGRAVLAAAGPRSLGAASTVEAGIGLVGALCDAQRLAVALVVGFLGVGRLAGSLVAGVWAVGRLGEFLVAMLLGVGRLAVSFVVRLLAVGLLNVAAKCGLRDVAAVPCADAARLLSIARDAKLWCLRIVNAFVHMEVQQIGESAPICHA